MDSILTSIKKLLGISESYEHFDTDLIIHINTVFETLNQLGVGPDEPFHITDEGDEWSDFSDDQSEIMSVRTYIYLKVKMIFDPPTNSIYSEAIKNEISELEWRMNVRVDKWG